MYVCFSPISTIIQEQAKIAKQNPREISLHKIAKKIFDEMVVSKGLYLSKEDGEGLKNLCQKKIEYYKLEKTGFISQFFSSFRNFFVFHSFINSAAFTLNLIETLEKNRKEYDQIQKKEEKKVDSSKAPFNTETQDIKPIQNLELTEEIEKFVKFQQLERSPFFSKENFFRCISEKNQHYDHIVSPLLKIIVTLGSSSLKEAEKTEKKKLIDLEELAYLWNLSDSKNHIWEQEIILEKKDVNECYYLVYRLIYSLFEISSFYQFNIGNLLTDLKEITIPKDLKINFEKLDQLLEENLLEENSLPKDFSIYFYNHPEIAKWSNETQFLFLIFLVFLNHVNHVHKEFDVKVLKEDLKQFEKFLYMEKLTKGIPYILSSPWIYGSIKSSFSLMSSLIKSMLPKEETILNLYFYESSASFTVTEKKNKAIDFSKRPERMRFYKKQQLFCFDLVFPFFQNLLKKHPSVIDVNEIFKLLPDIQSFLKSVIDLLKHPEEASKKETLKENITSFALRMIEVAKIIVPSLLKDPMYKNILEKTDAVFLKHYENKMPEFENWQFIPWLDNLLKPFYEKAS